MSEHHSHPTPERKTLKEWREELGLKQHELADLAQVSPAMLSRIERAESTIHGAVGEKILTTLEELGIPRNHVEKSNAKRKDEIAASAVWEEDGLAPDAPRRALAGWRMSRHLSQQELAVLSGVPSVSIIQIEQGKHRKTSLKNREKFARALRVRKDKLVLPGDDPVPDDTQPVAVFLRAELRGARSALQRVRDFIAYDPNIAHRALDARDALLRDIADELRGL